MLRGNRYLPVPFSSRQRDPVVTLEQAGRINQTEDQFSNKKQINVTIGFILRKKDVRRGENKVRIYE